MTNLEKLNELLKTVDGLPSFRRVVPSSLANKAWLLKVIPRHEHPEIYRLLTLSTREIFMEYVCHE